MSQPTLGPRVIEVTDAAKATLTESIVPRVVEIEDARPIEPPARAVPTPIVEPRRRRNRPRRIALAALGLSVVGFLILEAATWLGAQFERGLFLGLISATVLGCGALSSIYWIVAELRALLALKAVE